MLLEAALCGRPIFASRLEGIADAITDGHNGRLLPPQDAQTWIRELTTFIRPAPHFNISAQQAREFTLQNFGWDTVAGHYVNVWEKLVTSNSKS